MFFLKFIIVVLCFYILVHMWLQKWNSVYYIILYVLPFLYKFILLFLPLSFNFLVEYYILMLCFFINFFVSVVLTFYKNGFIDIFLRRPRLCKTCFIFIFFNLFPSYLFVKNITLISHLNIDNIYIYIYISFIIRYWRFANELICIECPDILISKQLDRVLSFFVSEQVTMVTLFVENNKLFSRLILLLILRVLLFNIVGNFSPIFISCLVILCVLFIDILLTYFSEYKYINISIILYIVYNIFNTEYNFYYSILFIVCILCSMVNTFYKCNFICIKSFKRFNTYCHNRAIDLYFSRICRGIFDKYSDNLYMYLGWKLNYKKKTFIMYSLLCFLKAYSILFYNADKICVDIYLMRGSARLRVLCTIPNHKFLLNIINGINKDWNNITTSYKDFLNHVYYCLDSNVSCVHTCFYLNEYKIYKSKCWYNYLHVKLLSQYGGNTCLCYFLEVCTGKIESYYIYKNLSTSYRLEHLSFLDLLKNGLEIKYEVLLYSSMPSIYNCSLLEFYNLTLDELISLSQELPCLVIDKIRLQVISFRDFIKLYDDLSVYIEKMKILELMDHLNKCVIKSLMNKTFRRIDIFAERYFSFSKYTFFHRLYLLELAIFYKKSYVEGQVMETGIYDLSEMCRSKLYKCLNMSISCGELMI